MKRKNLTRNALFTSIISLLLCVSMLVGTTFAWFTDEVTSSNNIIKSGTLDVEMYWADGTEAPASAEWADASTGAIFNYDLWEPGYVEVRHIKIANEGTLALKYQIKIVANGEVSDLADVIDVYYVDPAQQIADRTALTADKKIGTLTEALAGLDTTASGELAANTADTITLALKMQETAGNEYQNLAIGSDFSVILMATQLTAETDSFDDQYDFDATYTAEIDQLKAKLAAAKPGDVITFNLSHDAYVTESITVPNGTKLILNGNGHTIISNTNYVFVAKNAAVEISDVTIIGKAEHAIFTQGATWLAENPNVGVVLTNVTVDLDQATNFPITFNGKGDVVMKDCTVKGAGLPSVDHADGLHVFAGAEINLTVDGGNIGGIMLNANDADSATMTAKNGAVIDKVDIECATAANGSLVAAPVTNDGAKINDTVYAVYDAKQLKAALVNDGNVVLTENMTATAPLQVNGGTLNGNGNTLDFTGVKTSSWPSAYAVTLNNGGSKVENLTITNAGYAIGSTAATEDIYIDNVTTDYVTYAINGNGNNTNSVYVTNSHINGWISYSNIKLLSFGNCTLGKGNTGYAYLVVYGDTTFTGCTFESPFAMCARYQDGAVVAAGKTVTFTNCTYVQADGTSVKVTAENFASLFGKADDDDFQYMKQVNVVIDGVAVSWN